MPPAMPTFQAEVPSVGPTLASEQAKKEQVPMLGGWGVQGEGIPQSFATGVPDAAPIPQPATNTPQVATEVPQVNQQENPMAKRIPYWGASGVVSPKGQAAQEKVSKFMGLPEEAPSIAHILGIEEAQTAPKIEVETPGFGLSDPTSSTAQAGEDPFSAPIVQPQTPQADPNQQIRLADPTSSTAGQPTTLSGIPLSQFMSGAAIPEAGLQAESPLYSSESRGLTGDAGRDAFAEASDAREARQEQMLQSRDQARMDQRGGDSGELSMADAVDMAGGDRKKARAMVVASRQGDNEADDGLTPYQRASLSWQQEKFTAEQASKDYDRALKGAESDEEKAQIKQEMNIKENDLYNLHQDGFNRQERYINQALENTGLLSTGFASISKFVPGTPARQLEESLKPILGEAAFGRLQQMRDASKTGGALGQVSERELGLLESAMGALSTSQNESQFRSNLLAYRKQLRESNTRIQEKYKELRGGGSSGKTRPRYENDQNVGDSAESYYNPSK